MPVTIREMKDGSDFAICMAIRMEVFVREQQVPIDIEMDEFDATSTHYIAALDGAPVGTARTRVVDGVGKIERVAVRAEHRKSGAGRALMDHLIKRLRNHPKAKTIEISAQIQALPFYEKLGFQPIGELYDEANIPHQRMRLA